jgi:hypothetical protein
LQRRSDADYVNYTAVPGFKCKLLHDFFGGGAGLGQFWRTLQLDTNIKNSPPTLSNISVPANIGPGMNGAMIHVPAGDQGVLILI